MLPLRGLSSRHARAWVHRAVPSSPGPLGVRRLMVPLATQMQNAPGPDKSDEEEMEERKAMLRAASAAWQARPDKRRGSLLGGQAPAPAAAASTTVEDVQGGPDAPPQPPSGASSVGARFFGSMEKKNMMALDVTEFDSNGDIRVAGGKVSKMDLCAQHGLQPRDLRTLDNFKSQLPAILVRSQALIVNLEHIRALIKADLVIVLDPLDGVDRHHQAVFMYDLQERLRTSSSLSGGLPFELRALEAVLVSVCNVLRDQYNQLSPKAAAVLRRMEGRIDKALLLNMLDLSKKLTRFEARVIAVRDAMIEVLNSNDDMAGMYLTHRKSTGQAKPAEQHEEVEFMFEFYVKQIDELASQAAELISNIRSTQSIVKIELDSQRNSLLLFELRVTIGTFAASLASLGAAVFGMNLVNSLEASSFAFGAVTSTLLVASGATFAVLSHRMRRLVRTSWNESTPLSRISTSGLAPPHTSVTTSRHAGALSDKNDSDSHST